MSERWELGDPDDDVNERDSSVWGPMRHTGSRVCVVDNAKDTKYGRANAHLIAAAPDMSEALSAFVDRCKSHCDRYWECLMCHAAWNVDKGESEFHDESMTPCEYKQGSAALAKARGQ